MVVSLSSRLSLSEQQLALKKDNASSTNTLTSVSKETAKDDAKATKKSEEEYSSGIWDDKIAALTNQINEKELETARKQKESPNYPAYPVSATQSFVDSDKKKSEQQLSMASQRDINTFKDPALASEVFQTSNQSRFPNKFSSLPRNISLNERSDKSSEYGFPAAAYPIQEFLQNPPPGFIDQRMYPQMFYGSNYSLPAVPYMYPPLHPIYSAGAKDLPQDNFPSPLSSKSTSSRDFQASINKTKIFDNINENAGKSTKENLDEKLNITIGKRLNSTTDDAENNRKNNAKPRESGILAPTNQLNGRNLSGLFSDSAPLLNDLAEDSDTSKISTKKRRRRRRKTSVDEHAC